MNNKTWTVEWSENQQCFHVDTLQGIMQKNTEMFLNKINNEFALIGLFDSHAKAHEFIVYLRSERNIPYLEEQIGK